MIAAGICLCAMTSLMSCDKIKDATSKDFTVDNVRFDFEAVVAGGVPKAAMAIVRTAETNNSFSVTRTVNLDEIGSDDIVEYADKISKVMVNSSLLHVTVSPADTHSVTNLTVTAAGVAGSLVIPSCTVGGDFTLPDNTKAYTTAFIMKLLSAGSLTVTVEGQTDAPAGTTINVRYENDLIFTASLL
jgi:hypothetical protein